MLKVKIAIYYRVSTAHADQIESLNNQIHQYKQMVKRHIDWQLVDVYADIQSGKNTTDRVEFQRMLSDCYDHKIDLIITKSVSRFGRNTADTLYVINKLHSLLIDVYFEVENIRISETSKTFLLSILEAVAQADVNQEATILGGVFNVALRPETQNFIIASVMTILMLLMEILL